VIAAVATENAASLPGMSQAVVARRPLLFVSGQVALDADGTLVGKGNFELQAMQVMKNLGAVLEAGGAGFDSVVKIVVYLSDIRYLQVWRSLRHNYFADPFPASTLVVAGLISPDLLIEVEAVAETKGG
jgi:enamine deaminase RidA (YjgF/YER057c/UK114 family)